MKKMFEKKKFYLLALLPLAAIAICAWQEPKNIQRDSQLIAVNQKDTVPNKSYNENDFDLDLGNIDNAMKELSESMSRLDEQMKHLDLNLEKEIEASLAKVDFDKIGEQINESMKAINWKEIDENVNNSIEKAQEGMKKIDFDKLNDEMKDIQQKFQSEEFKKQFDSEKFHKEIDEAMNNAKESIEKASKGLQEMKNFEDELARDGLIDKKKGYTIQWKSGELYINGKKQSKEVSDKYRKYDKGDYQINMNKDSEKF